MPDVQLNEAVLTDGTRQSNFFNGRLLTADALRTDQTAHRERLCHLGQLAGEGVAHGLTVRAVTRLAKQPTIEVAPGLALNRKGQMLSVPGTLGAINVRLVPAAKPALSLSGTGLFEECSGDGAAGDPDDVFTITGKGLYVFAIAPAADYQERVLKIGLEDEGVARSCGSRYLVDGVQFRLVPLSADVTKLFEENIAAELVALLENNTAAGVERSRNLLAHVFLGTPAGMAFTADLFRWVRGDFEGASSNPLEFLRSQNILTDFDVPLALIHWGDTGLRIVDMWSVRRRVHKRSRSYDGPFPDTDERRVTAEAAYLQFQDQVAEMTRPGQASVAGVRARDYFRYLPAAGVLPLTGSNFSLGFNPDRFFAGLTHRRALYIEGAKVRDIIARSFDYPPIDLTRAEHIWLYVVRENGMTRAAGGANTPDPYLIFANGHMPFEADAQYDLSRWDFSNYTSLLDE